MSKKAKHWFAGMGSKEIWNLENKQGFSFIGTIGKNECLEKRSPGLKKRDPDVFVTQILKLGESNFAEEIEESELLAIK